MTLRVLKSHRSKMSLVYIWSQRKASNVTSQLLPIRQWTHDKSYTSGHDAFVVHIVGTSEPKSAQELSKSSKEHVGGGKYRVCKLSVFLHMCLCAFTYIYIYTYSFFELNWYLSQRRSFLKV